MSSFRIQPESIKNVPKEILHNKLSIQPCFKSQREKLSTQVRTKGKEEQITFRRLNTALSSREQLSGFWEAAPPRQAGTQTAPSLTGRFSFCCSAAFFFHSRSLSSLTRLSMTATSELRLFKHSLCCCSLAFCSWFSLFLNWTKQEGNTKITMEKKEKHLQEAITWLTIT